MPVRMFELMFECLRFQRVPVLGLCKIKKCDIYKSMLECEMRNEESLETQKFEVLRVKQIVFNILYKYKLNRIESSSTQSAYS